ncbi:MAG: PorT family protein, partial [Cyclobacteriaceae bacterium]
KIKYKEDGEVKKVKDKQSHGLNDIRYGLYTRIGIGGFNWFFMYNASSLFKTNKGPEMTEMNTFTAGISINGF